MTAAKRSTGGAADPPAELGSSYSRIKLSPAPTQRMPVSKNASQHFHSTPTCFHSTYQRMQGPERVPA